MAQGDWVQGETIAAIATPRGTGGIAIIKVSGKDAVAVAAGCLSARGARKLSRARGYTAFFDRVVSPHSGETIDEVIVLVMRSPRSYTGEDVVELQCHGGELVAEKVLDAVLSRGARMAEPGEFTRRAFLNGKITLDEAEAVLDVVSAKTDRALRQAFLRLEGKLGKLVLGCRERIAGVLSRVQAALDFPDDISLRDEEVVPVIEEVTAEIDSMLEEGVLGLALTSGVELTLVGRPNVGKSSLFNALIGEDRAIVTEIPGTTRDLLRERVQWSGIPVVLVDTAGLRQTREIVEAIGVERARKAAEESWAALYVVDATEPLADEDWYWLERWRDRRVVVVLNKADIAREDVRREISALVEARTGFPVVEVSARTGSGLERLKETVVGMFGGAERESVVPGSARQVACLRRAREALVRALEAWKEGWTWDVVASEMEEACRGLDELTGSRISEDVLDEIFSRFCVGK
ncbi:MAG: tRNA uridine-5-carboxymethylaminomethyl(34) synthesis GTPase MnmE [Firmicutes bacterium]|nr:tRNA uridine-5-carboxymethylaminomethyl(34) synthesis GTPase MnmE [Candidatus Fermentithermobacillaceae bacterium]